MQASARGPRHVNLKKGLTPGGHVALTGCSLHRSSHSCPHRQRRWKWSPRTSAQSRSKWTRISYRAPHRGQPRWFEKGGSVATEDGTGQSPSFSRRRVERVIVYVKIHCAAEALNHSDGPAVAIGHASPPCAASVEGEKRADEH